MWKRYWRTWALKGVSLSISEPGIYVLYGPNGSGKSTLIRVLLGVTRPTRGRVRVLGMDPSWRPGRVLHRVSAALEGAAIPPYMSGVESVAAVAEARGLSVNVFFAAAEALGVIRYWRRPVYTYSMGMRKRLLLATALGLAFHKSIRVLFLDEPYTLLDQDSRNTVSNLVIRLSQRIPIVIATHVITRAEETASSLIVLEEGTIAKVYRRDSVNSYFCPLSDEALELARSNAGLYKEIVIRRDESRVIFVEGPSPGLRGCEKIIVPPALR